MEAKITPHVVIIGGGFGGLMAARKLARSPVRITLIDRKNHHTFQPLLYQVATAGLSPGEIPSASGEDELPLNFVVVGGGPTGVELAGTLAEIAHRVLANEFRSIDPKRTRILLLEGGPRILPAYPEDLSQSAVDQLQRLGVEVQTSSLVTGIEPGGVRMGEARMPAAV